MPANGSPWYQWGSIGNVWYFDQFLTAQNRQLLGNLEGKVVADIGYADGDLGLFLSSLVADVDLVDSPTTNVNGFVGARTLADELGLKVDLHAVDLDSQFHLTRDHYDIILFLGLLDTATALNGPHHTHGPRKASLVGTVVPASRTDACPVKRNPWLTTDRKRPVIGKPTSLWSNLVFQGTLQRIPDHASCHPRLREERRLVSNGAGFRYHKAHCMAFFDRLVWQQNPDRIILDDLIFDLGRQRQDEVGGGSDSFIFLKERRILDQYDALWGACPPPAGWHMLELGIQDGGSIAFWCELLQPARYAALDIMPWKNTSYFNRFIETRGFGDRVTCHWGTDQADVAKLQTIVADDLLGRLDLVIDDASHQYIPTKASFEALFPLIRPGGLYVIEDWSWGCWPNLPENFFLAKGTEPDRLIAELAVAAGRMSGFIVGQGPFHFCTLAPLISRVTIMNDIAIVERGPADGAMVPGFTLESYTTRRK